MTPDLSLLVGFAHGVLVSLRCTCHMSAFGFVDPIRFATCLLPAKLRANFCGLLCTLHKPPS